MVINDRSPVRVNGAILEEYEPLTEENPYIFDSVSARPWHGNVSAITSARFGSEVAPASMAYWFADTNLSSINWNKCNTENLTSLRTAFARTKLSEVVLPPMPALTNLRFAFSEVEPLTRADFSQVGASGITDCYSAFKGSYALETVDLSGLAGTVEDSAFMFGNMTATAPNMGVRTIYATEDLDFRSASASNNMFRSCVDLVGGAGTVYSDSHKDKEYARIDTGSLGYTGYFTLPATRKLFDGAYNGEPADVLLPGFVSGNGLYMNLQEGFTFTKNTGEVFPFSDPYNAVLYDVDVESGYIFLPGELDMTAPEAEMYGGLGFKAEGDGLHMIFIRGTDPDDGIATVAIPNIKVFYLDLSKLEPI